MVCENKLLEHVVKKRFPHPGDVKVLEICRFWKVCRLQLIIVLSDRMMCRNLARGLEDEISIMKIHQWTSGKFFITSESKSSSQTAGEPLYQSA